MASIERNSTEQIGARRIKSQGSEASQIQVSQWARLVSLFLISLPFASPKAEAQGDSANQATLLQTQENESREKQLWLEQLEKQLRQRQTDSDPTSAPQSSISDPRRGGLKLKGAIPERPDKLEPKFGDDPSEKIAPDSGTVVEALPTPESDAQAMGQKLQLSDVIASTYRAFPLLEIARLQSGVAAGQQTSAWGAYDTKLEYYSLNQAVGFYETYRNGIGVARQLWWGGYASAGYRIGRGEFESWYKERETNAGGEFKVALVQPLLQGRAIDPQRVELFQANLRRQAVEPEIQSQVLIAGQEAARAFWLWVEIGNVLKAQERLLEIAQQRGEQLELALQKGWFSELTVNLNSQQIYDRQLKVNETRQKFRDTAYKLSLFLRDESGFPLMVPPEWLPTDFPEVAPLPPGNFGTDFQNAVNSRPELRLIALDVQSLRLELNLALNQMLPNLDFTIQSVQNVGEGTASTNDKGQFQLEAGVIGGVPIQRRKAVGKSQSTQAKLAQISQKYEFQRNKIEIELRTARNAIDISQQNVETARNLLKQANLALEGFRKSFTAGQVDLFFLLNQEVKVNDSEVKLLEAERDFFTAIAAMQAALGLDPLEQAANLTVR
jgi:outer membrane protein TolC